MFLRPPAWAEDLMPVPPPSPSTSSASPRQAPHSSPSASSSSSSPGTFHRSGAGAGVVEELVQSLVSQRQRREVALRLREALRNAKAEFSFARVKGLRRLLGFLTLAAASERGVELFRESQSYQELQVIPALFKHTLAPQRSPASVPAAFLSSEEPAQVVNPPTSAEIVLALRVLEGCCLLDNSSKVAAAQHLAVKELLELLSASGIPERSACLDALLALMLDSPANQKEFDYYRGIRKVAESINNRHVDLSLRMKCAEFLLLLVGDVFPKTEHLQDELRKCLGTECSVIVLDVYSKLDPAFADPERKRRYSWDRYLIFARHIYYCLRECAFEMMHELATVIDVVAVIKWDTQKIDERNNLAVAFSCGYQATRFYSLVKRFKSCNTK